MQRNNDTLKDECKHTTATNLTKTVVGCWELKIYTINENIRIWKLNTVHENLKGHIKMPHYFRKFKSSNMTKSQNDIIVKMCIIFHKKMKCSLSRVAEWMLTVPQQVIKVSTFAIMLEKNHADLSAAFSMMFWPMPCHTSSKCWFSLSMLWWTDRSYSVTFVITSGSTTNLNF